MAPQAFSAPTLGATSKVIKKNEEVRRSRDSRFRSRTREVGSKENQEIGSAGSDDSGHFLSDGHKQQQKHQKMGLPMTAAEEFDLNSIDWNVPLH